MRTVCDWLITAAAMTLSASVGAAAMRTSPRVRRGKPLMWCSPPAKSPGLIGHFDGECGTDDPFVAQASDNHWIG